MKWLLARAYGHLLLLGLCAWGLMWLLCAWLAQALVFFMPAADAVLWSSLAGLPIVLLVGWFGISRRALKQMHKYWGLLLITFATVIWSSGTASYFRMELDTWSLPQAAQEQLAVQQKRKQGLMTSRCKRSQLLRYQLFSNTCPSKLQSPALGIYSCPVLARHILP